jgi:hypothetical protein
MIKSFKVLAFAVCSVLLSGCPATIKVALTNESQQPISVVYSTGFESEIAQGKTKKEHYKLDCIRIKQGEYIYEYEAVIPPKKYFRSGVFSSSIDAIFTSDHRLIVYLKEKREDHIELNKGC